MLRVQTRTETNIALSGDWVFTDHLHFKEFLERLLASELPAPVEFDLSELEFIDSAGLGMLLIARDELNQASKPLSLKGPVGQVKRMFEISRFETLFSISP